MFGNIFCVIIPLPHWYWHTGTYNLPPSTTIDTFRNISNRLAFETCSSSSVVGDGFMRSDRLTRKAMPTFFCVRMESQRIDLLALWENSFTARASAIIEEDLGLRMERKSDKRLFNVKPERISPNFDSVTLPTEETEKKESRINWHMELPGVTSSYHFAWVEIKIKQFYYKTEFYQPSIICLSLRLVISRANIPFTELHKKRSSTADYGGGNLLFAFIAKSQLET